MAEGEGVLVGGGHGRGRQPGATSLVTRRVGEGSDVVGGGERENGLGVGGFVFEEGEGGVGECRQCGRRPAKALMGF